MLLKPKGWALVAVAVIAVHAQSVAKAETKAAATPTTFLHS